MHAWTVSLSYFANPPSDLARMDAILGQTNYVATRNYEGMTPAQATAMDALEDEIAARRAMRAESDDLIRAELLRRYPEQETAIRFSSVNFNESTHRLLIEYALREGLPVSESALEAYPDLSS